MPLLIDAHLDLAWNALQFDRDLTEPVQQINARERGMTDSLARGNATVALPEMRRGPVGIIVAREGADGIVTPAQVDEWFEGGLRVASLVHDGHNQYAYGTGESGRLSGAGVELLREFQRIGMILDTTHLSDEGFFHSLDVFDGPVIASHQNCRALVPAVRQFTDEQLRLLIDRKAIIGAPFDNWMIIPDWRTGQTPRAHVSLELLANHIDHICQLAGNHAHVAIGTDLDGGHGTEQCPAEIETIADVQLLADVLARRGYTPEVMDCNRNALNIAGTFSSSRNSA